MYLRAFGLLLLISCNFSYAGLFDDKEARQLIAAQQTSIGDLRNQGQALEARLGTIEETLSTQSLLELHSRIEALRMDLNKLQGQIEVLLNQNETMQKRQKDFYVDLDTRLRRIEQGGAVAQDLSSGATESAGSAPVAAIAESSGAGRSNTDSTAAHDVASATVMSPAPEVSTPVNEGREAYEAAFDMFKSGKYQEAASGFSRFVQDHPESALAPSAQYWMGNSYYALRDFKNAISAQEKLIKNYPNSAKVPDAMLNIASSQQELNQKAAARKTLDNVVARYPGTQAAEKARQRLHYVR